MATAANLRRDERVAISAAIAPYVTTVFRPEGSTAVELSETFSLWYFNGTVEHADEPFAEHVVPSGQLYHQIFVAGVPAGFAQSNGPRGNHTRRITRVARSSLADLLNQAIDIIEPVVPSTTEVRLLKARLYHLSALWLVDGAIERLYVVSCPTFISALPLGTFLTPREFMSGLAAAERSLRQRQSAWRHRRR